MMKKKLAIASAVALMSMGSVYAQQTTVTTNVADNAPGLMTTLSNSVERLFGTLNSPAVAPVAGVPESYAVYVTVPLLVGGATDAGKPKYVLDINGTYRLATAAELALTGLLAPVFYAFTPAVAPVVGVAEVKNGMKPVDITFLGGAVNLSAINGGINITGTNVNLSGVTGALTGLSTTVIGAMNSSTLDIAKGTENVSNMAKKSFGIAGLANQGADVKGVTDAAGITLPAGLLPNTQFNLTGLTSSTETLSTQMNDKLQNMNVFNMAVNMAPLVAGVNIAATLNPHSWFMGPQTGEVKLAGLQVATTAIGAMNSSITRLGAKLSN